MGTTWYYKVGDGEVGPVTALQLRQKALRSEIRPETFVRQGVDGRWVRADSVQGLLQPSVQGPAGPPRPPVATPIARTGQSPPPLPSTGMSGWVASIAAVGLILLGMVLGLLVVRWSYRPEAKALVAASPARPRPTEIAPAKEAPATVVSPPARADRPEAEAAGPVEVPAEAAATGARPEPVQTAAVPVAPPPPSRPGDERPLPVEPRPEEPAIAKPEGPKPEEPGPEEMAADESSGTEDRGDSRIDRFQAMYTAVLPLFKKWEKLESEAAPLRAQLAPVVALCMRLEQQNMRLQRDLQMLESAYRSVQNDPDSADSAADLAARISDKQRQITMLVAPLSRARAERAGLEARIRELTEHQLQLVKSAGQQSKEWISLSDPFGKLGPATHQRVVELMAGWIIQQPKLARPYLARGFSYLRLGEHQRALADFEAVAKYDPRLAALCAAARGYTFAKQGDLRRSGVEFGKASKLDPKLGIVHVFRGQTYIDQGKYSQANKELRLALRTGSNVPEVQEAMALLLAACPRESICDGKKAVEHATKACELIGWENWAYLSTLAAAYAEAGQFDEAVRWAGKAIDLAPEESRGELRKRLSLYQAAKPYRLK